MKVMWRINTMVGEVLRFILNGMTQMVVSRSGFSSLVQHRLQVIPKIELTMNLDIGHSKQTVRLGKLDGQPQQNSEPINVLEPGTNRYVRRK